MLESVVVGPQSRDDCHYMYIHIVWLSKHEGAIYVFSLLCYNYLCMCLQAKNNKVQLQEEKVNTGGG